MPRHIVCRLYGSASLSSSEFAFSYPMQRLTKNDFCFLQLVLAFQGKIKPCLKHDMQCWFICHRRAEEACLLHALAFPAQSMFAVAVLLVDAGPVMQQFLYCRNAREILECFSEFFFFQKKKREKKEKENANMESVCLLPLQIPWKVLSILSDMCNHLRRIWKSYFLD